MLINLSTFHLTLYIFIPFYIIYHILLLYYYYIIFILFFIHNFILLFLPFFSISYSSKCYGFVVKWKNTRLGCGWRGFDSRQSPLFIILYITIYVFIYVYIYIFLYYILYFFLFIFFYIFIYIYIYITYTFYFTYSSLYIFLSFKNNDNGRIRTYASRGEVISSHTP